MRLKLCCPLLAHVVRCKSRPGAGGKRSPKPRGGGFGESSASVWRKSCGLAQRVFDFGAGPTIAPRSCLVGPTTIRRLIVAVVVDPIKFVPFGARPKVGEEIEEVPPAFANRDTSGPVVAPARVLRVCATLDHCAPSGVFSARSFARLTVDATAAHAALRLRFMSGIPAFSFPLVFI